MPDRSRRPVYDVEAGLLELARQRAQGDDCVRIGDNLAADIAPHFAPHLRDTAGMAIVAAIASLNGAAQTYRLTMTSALHVGAFAGQRLAHDARAAELSTAATAAALAITTDLIRDQLRGLGVPVTDEQAANVAAGLAVAGVLRAAG
ncbi:hypothetical protein [Umezawaea beigongshangensis]|uniref:hypothetical protein n=1 Tax=Umezawaea beigongshangensis TaxID=2780383 RepID=UPI0018F174F8|nr:hypothetical protein [Umezawaea beigongshangensis]